MSIRNSFCLVVLAVALASALPVHAQNAAITLDKLTQGRELHGFRVEALYLGDADVAIGARFVHLHTGFIFDLVRSQSVPQSFIWVNSFPTSDMGEPHTQEHLLLGKGNKGRYVASLEDMALTSSSAFTMQWRTCYHAHTSAGPDVYFHVLRMQLDALLNPDYTDEEIRREVANFGAHDIARGNLRLAEKGTVYNEMVSAFQGGWSRMSRALDIALYGKDHPLAYVSGGLPAAIRQMKPEAIRRFHRENYQLGNMGMIGAYPKEMALVDILQSMNGILNELDSPETVATATIRSEADLPAPKMAPEGTISLAEYPHQNASQPGPMLLAWPPVLKPSLVDGMLLDLFIENIAGDPSTNLYATFIDSRTRALDIGATSVFGWRSNDQGSPVIIGLGNVSPAAMNEKNINEIRRLIREELVRIASWPADSPELRDFNARLANRIVEHRRANSNFVNSPPGFGFRSSGAGWMEQLRLLERSGTFRRSVTMEPQLDSISTLLSKPGNIWSEKLRTAWKLIDTRPYVSAAVPRPELFQQEYDEGELRIATEVARLRAYYGVDNDHDAILRYLKDYRRETHTLDSIAALVQTPKFVDSPPLTLDDQLDYRVTNLPGNIPLVSSTFQNMTSGTVGIAMRLDGVPQDELPWLSLLPALIRDVGVLQADGTPITNTEMSNRLRQEILGLNTYFSTNFTTGRAELVVRGAGNNAEETKRAIEWMQAVLFRPDWRPENLQRLRDVVDQELSGLRGTMQGREESWVNNPAAAYWRQDNPLLQATGSFLARTHNALCLRWLLKDVGDDKSSAMISTFLFDLGALSQAPEADSSLREELEGLLTCLLADSPTECEVEERLAPIVQSFHSLPSTARELAVEAARDLKLTLSDIPDETLASDWHFLCNRMKSNLLIPPAKALADLKAVYSNILRSGGARTFVIGSSQTQQTLAGPIKELVAGLEQSPVKPAQYSNRPSITRRMYQHSPQPVRPVFVGLVNPNSSSGVFLNSAPGTGYKQTDRESLLDFLASLLYSGGGAHTIFMKTWGAGLAYSNGVRISPHSGRLNYYAERCPTLPQTLKFVIDELKRAPNDPALVEYAIAQAFSGSRAAASYESRGESMAADLADGLTPDDVTQFRRAILALRSAPNLGTELHNRLASVCGKVMPGFGPRSGDVADGVYMVIGPEKQLDLYQNYLHTAEGRDARLFRLYPRDFWMVW